MGSSIKKLARLGNNVSPHTLILGKKASMGMDFGGQVLGAYDDQYKPADIEAANRTVVATGQGERWFCSEEEARAAGWRRARE